MILSIQRNLETLQSVLVQLSNTEFQHKSIYLSNASIGGHTRHIIEIAECMVNGYNSGFIDYINRKRNMEIETSKAYALLKIIELNNSLNLMDKPLEVICESEHHSLTVQSTYYRELMYNNEHIIHHLALIKVTLVELNLNIVDENFGFAYSTVKYKNNPVKSNT